MLQDSFSDLYDGASAADSGTLFNLKCRFNHRTVTANVTEHVNQAYDLMQFSTEGLICLLAMDMLAMDDLSGDPPPETELEEVSKKIVSFLRPFLMQQDWESDRVRKEFCVCCASTEDLDGMKMMFQIILSAKLKHLLGYQIYLTD